MDVRHRGVSDGSMDLVTDGPFDADPVGATDDRARVFFETDEPMVASDGRDRLVGCEWVVRR